MNEETQNALRAAFAAGAYELARVIVDESGYKFWCWHELWLYMPVIYNRSGSVYPVKANLDEHFATYSFKMCSLRYDLKLSCEDYEYERGHPVRICKFNDAVYARIKTE